MRGAIQKAKTWITRVLVDRSADGSAVPEIQVSRFGQAKVVEQFQPQGLYFRAPPGAEGLLLAPMGSTSGAVLIDASDRGTWPAGGDIPDGAGGLHYLGAWKVYLDDSGNVHLGEQAGAAPVSRDDKVQAELTALRDTVNDLVTAYNAHVHTTTATVGTGPAGVIAPTTGTATAPAAVGDTACEKVKGT